MDAHKILSWLQPALGVLVILFILLDVFMTVLYARVGTGILSYIIGKWTWAVFKWGTRPFAKRRGNFLSFCGPVIVVLLIAAWGFGLALGTALIIHQQLGRTIVATNGPTPTDFGTAIFVGGSSLSIIGVSDFSPKTRVLHWLFFVNSLVGMSVISLTVTYVLQIYTALQNRNAFALKIHIGAGQRGDAAEWVVGAGPRGRFDLGYSTLVEAGGELVHVKESHHFYPVIFYFRFASPFYSVSQFTLTLLDSVSLIKSTLHDQEYAWLKESGALSQLWQGSILLLKMLNDTFVPGRLDDIEAPPSEENMTRWRRRYREGFQRIQEAGIRTVEDQAAGSDRYVSLRAEWDPYIMNLSKFGAYQADEVDPVGMPAGK